MNWVGGIALCLSILGFVALGCSVIAYSTREISARIERPLRRVWWRVILLVLLCWVGIALLLAPVALLARDVYLIDQYTEMKAAEAEKENAKQNLSATPDAQ